MRETTYRGLHILIDRRENGWWLARWRDSLAFGALRSSEAKTLREAIANAKKTIDTEVEAIIEAACEGKPPLCCVCGAPLMHDRRVLRCLNCGGNVTSGKE